MPDQPYHLLIARNVRRPEETKYYVSNAPPDTSVQKLHAYRLAKANGGAAGVDGVGFADIESYGE